MYLKFLRHTEQRAREGTDSKNYTSTTNMLKIQNQKIQIKKTTNTKYNDNKTEITAYKCKYTKGKQPTNVI